MKYLTLINDEDKHNKFWEAELDEKTHTVTCRWGRLGTKGQSKEFHHSSKYQAERFIDSKADEKYRKGYRKVDEEKLNLKQLQAELVGAGCKIHELSFIQFKDARTFNLIEDQALLANPNLQLSIYCSLQLIGESTIYHLLIDAEQVYHCNIQMRRPWTPHATDCEISSKELISEDSPRILKKIRDKAPGIVSALIR